MSYRSDVRIILRKKDFEELKKQYKENYSKELENLTICKELRRENYGNEVDEEFVDLVYFGWNGIKWYSFAEEFENLAFIENFIKEHNGSFARIGEEYEDFEEFGKCCGWYASSTYSRRFDDDLI